MIIVYLFILEFKCTCGDLPCASMGSANYLFSDFLTVYLTLASRLYTVIVLVRHQSDG